MTKLASIAAGATALILVSLPAQAVVITYDHDFDSDGVPTSMVDGANVNSFNSGLFDWSDGNAAPTVNATGGGFHLVTGDLSGRYAAPFISDGPAAGTDDPTQYFSVPSNSSSGSAEFVFTQTYNYFGLLWGSIDAYNSITFLLNGLEVVAFSGSDVINPSPANGNQTAPGTNTYVNFFQLDSFDSVILSSNGYAFESDNMAVAQIPEPSTLGLFAIGLIGVGLMGQRRRRSRNTV